jgi:hypothetical protein
MPQRLPHRCFLDVHVSGEVLGLLAKSTRRKVHYAVEWQS